MAKQTKGASPVNRDRIRDLERRLTIAETVAAERTAERDAALARVRELEALVLGGDDKDDESGYIRLEPRSSKAVRP